VRRRPDIAGGRMRPIIRRRRVVQGTNAEQSPDTYCLARPPRGLISGMRLRAAAIASVAVAPFLATAACGQTATSSHANYSCAGQCASPYELDVVFRPGTSRSAARAAMDRCRTARPAVIRIGPVQWQPVLERLGAIILTKSMPGLASPPPTVPSSLLVCLRATGVIETAGWPD
jgi:hypothetical protein